MKYIGNKISDINIAYIGGGSKDWAWGLMNDLALEEQLSGNVRLYDINKEAAHENEIIGNSLLNYQKAKGEWHYKVVTSLKEALNGADFVVISILPGTFKEMYSDVHAPEKYGIYQSVGDTVGPGGLIRSLRTIPMYVEIAEAIKSFSPKAWVINYTNPMTICTRTLYHVFPGIKAFGCCHGVFETQNLIVKVLEDLKGIKNISREDIKLNILGINHFTWADKATFDGEDIFPLYRQFVDKYFETGYETSLTNETEAIYFRSAQRVQLDLFKRYGLIAASGDRHVSEFCPPWYLKNPQTVESWKFVLTPVNYRIEDLADRCCRSKRLVSGEEKLDLKKSEEEGVIQIKALLGLGDLVTNVNLPNFGQMKGLPLGCVVETNAIFSRGSITPLFAGRLPDDVNSLVMRHVNIQETTLKAALSFDKELAFRAFANDPLMTASIDDARKLFNEMLENTREYLTGWPI
jgi:galacturan 1,4-alpha-galacturonidase